MADAHAPLSPKADKVIAALLSEQSIEDAALKSGVASRSIHRWLATDEAFKQAYRHAKRRVVEQAQSRLQRASGRAVSALIGVLDDELAPAAVKVSAAKIILDMSVKAIELDDLETRIEALEAAQKVSLNGTHATRY
jgi:hypothetical protein